MLVAQMVSVHVMAMRCAHQLASAQDIAQQDSAGRALGRLARTFPAQIEALNRYRSHGEPAITVQNVSVGDGGKAIVGNVTQHASVIVSDADTRRGGDERSRRQYWSDAGEPTLRRKNPLRRIVPFAGGARQKALPHARRRAGIRRTKGKPERAGTACSLGMRSPSVGRSGTCWGSAEVVEDDEMICFRKGDAATPAWQTDPTGPVRTKRRHWVAPATARSPDPYLAFLRPGQRAVRFTRRG
jgi:hypothetical protein